MEAKKSRSHENEKIYVKYLGINMKLNKLDE